MLLLSWRKQWKPTPVLLPGESHGWRSLVGCSPWCCEESDMTERLHFHFLPSCIGEGNGNSLQCSCLENPRDGGAWWAAVYDVTQSQTRLKRLSSSSSRKAGGKGIQSPWWWCWSHLWGSADFQTEGLSPQRHSRCRKYQRFISFTCTNITNYW